MTKHGQMQYELQVQNKGRSSGKANRNNLKGNLTRRRNPMSTDLFALSRKH